MKLVMAVAAGLAGFATLTASGAVVSYSDTIPTAKTSWSDSLSVPKFNPALGTLTGILWSFGGNVEGDLQAESLDAAPANLSLDLKAAITVQKPGGGNLASLTPLVNQTFGATAFDGGIDFAGTSGVSYLGLAASGSTGGTIANSEWADWTGVGNVVLPTEAVGQSSGTGAGNLLQLFRTEAGANIRVEYSYDPQVVPEPATLAMNAVVLLGIAGGAWYRRSKKA